MKLRSGLFLLNALIIALTVVPLVALVFGFTDSGFRSYVYQGDVVKARAFAPLIASFIQESGTWPGVKEFLDHPPFTFHAIPTGPDGLSIHNDDPAKDDDRVRERVVIVDPDLYVVVDTKHVLEGSRHPPNHLSDAVPILSPGKQILAYVLVGTMVEPALTPAHEQFMNAFSSAVLLGFLASALAGGIFSAILAVNLSRPIKNLSRAAREVADGRPLPPIPLRGPVEWIDLLQSFQTMSATIRETERRKARLVADSAHELRTPLSLIQGTLEAMMDGVFPLDKETLKPVFEESLRLSRIVEDLLDLESLQAGALHFDYFDPRAPARRLFALYRPAMDRAAIDWHYSEPEDLPLMNGDQQRWEQVLSNLIDNALRHTSSNGHIAVNLRYEANAVVFEVADSGPGIPEAERDKVFERFYRVDESRSSQTGGRGLGLAVVKSICDAHGADIRVTASQQWGGALFSIRWPRQDP